MATDRENAKIVAAGRRSRLQSNGRPQFHLTTAEVQRSTRTAMRLAATPLSPSAGFGLEAARQGSRGGWEAGYARSMPDRDPIETDDAIVLVLGAPGGLEPPGHLEGVTRLEKLIFLLERETPARDWMTDKADFRSYRFGPFSSKVYKAVDTLVAADIVRDSAKKSEDNSDRWESVSALMEEGDLDPYTTRDFMLTERGNDYYQALLRELPASAEQILSDFKKRFASLPLRQLVRYVYERYPQFTDKSEIRDEILGN